MENLEYWKISLNEALPNITFNDKEIENIISISEMEIKYCENHNSKSKNVETDKEKIELRKQLEILKDFIKKKFKVDDIYLQNNEVLFYRK
jgi:hypothetical protein